MTTDQPTDYAELIARIDKWDRCYPGNCNVEKLVDDCRSAIASMQSERRELLAKLDGLDDEMRGWR